MPPRYLEFFLGPRAAFMFFWVLHLVVLEFGGVESADFLDESLCGGV